VPPIGGGATNAHETTTRTKGDVMSVCLILQFPGIDEKKYEGVMKELGLKNGKTSWPKGIVSHVAGVTNEGFCVVDVWNSKQEFDTFMDTRLKPAFQAAGGLPQPRVMTFDVHNSHFSARM